MTGEEVAANWFSTYHYITYLFILFVLMVVYYQWKWAKVCKENIQVLVAQQGGGGAFHLAPKEGGVVKIEDSKTQTTRVWPVNELATIDILYPGVGFIPGFLQKTIRLAIVNEGDWEPMLNRSPHRENIASPDIVSFLKTLAEESNDEDAKKKIEKVLSGIRTGPTREMIADPALLGSLEKSSVLRVLATVSDELTDAMRSVNTRLSKLVSLNPTVVYIGLGLAVIVAVVLAFFQIPQAKEIKEMADDVNQIKQSLGIQTPPAP